MGDFNDFDLEIENLRGSTPESFITTITTAGSPVTVSPSSGDSIKVAYVNVPLIGPNSTNNTINRYILYSTDSGTTYHTLRVNESINIPGVFQDLRIDSSHNGMKVEIEMRS